MGMETIRDWNPSQDFVSSSRIITIYFVITMFRPPTSSSTATMSWLLLGKSPCGGAKATSVTASRALSVLSLSSWTTNRHDGGRPWPPHCRHEKNAHPPFDRYKNRRADVVPSALERHVTVRCYGSSSTVHNETTTTTTTPFTTTTRTSPLDDVTLEFYQYAICPFCNKTKAFLHYANIPYEAHEVNPLTKAELAWASKDYRKVPMARFQRDDDQTITSPDDDTDTTVQVWKGSDDIVEQLLQHTSVKESLQDKWKSSSMTLSEFCGTDTANDNSNKTAQDWIHFANTELAVLLYPNLCSTLSKSYHAFEYVHTVPQFSIVQQWSIRLVGSLAMYLAASRVKRTCV